MADEFAVLWTLDPSIDFLNHGSFGACPRAVLEKQAEWRARLERQPVLFLSRELEGLLDAARAALAEFVGADADDLAFVPNATSGVNGVVRSLELQEGDELLTTDHSYNSCRNALRWHEGRGVKVVTAHVPWPLAGPWQVLEALQAAATPRTRLVLVDHVTSPTGLVFPVGEIVRLFAQREVDVLVDGAHAPGMLPLDLRALGAAYYTGNCHKWLCSPKGAAFLYVRRDKQPFVKPLAHGHGLNSARTDRSAFRLQHDWVATSDPTAYLCVPEAIRYLGSLLPGGFPELMERNHDLVLKARRLLCSVLGVEPPAPEFMLGSLAAVPVRDAGPELQKWLYDVHHIEVPVMWKHLRISAQLYNSLDQYERLAACLSSRT